jgi:uncharacterized protein
MQRTLDLAASLVGRRPGWVISVIAVVTVLLGAAASQVRIGVDIADFGTGTELAEAFDRVTEEFGSRDAVVTVIVDAGEDRSVLDPEGIRLAAELEESVRASDAADSLAPETDLVPAITSWATPVLQALQVLDSDIDANIDLSELDAELLDQLGVTDEQWAGAVAEAYDAPGATEAAALLSLDADIADAAARGGQMIVRLDPGLDDDERNEASLEVAAALSLVDSGDIEVLPFNQALLSAELEDVLVEEVPILLAAEMALILAILAIAFRRFSDVVSALVGVGVTLVWLFGFVALAGPGILGITGPFSQMAIAVPILLVGLGVDYSFHLTLRYREERKRSHEPAEASATAVRTVGRALVLVTLTTAIGFLANVISPLPPIVDFAIFTAAGIVGAMVVMGLLIPSIRHLLDRRSGAKDPPAEQPGRVVDAMALAARASARHPIPVLGIIVVLAGLGLVAALDLETDFDQEQFIPEGTRVEAVFDATQELFDGGVAEQTWVLIDGDATDPALANAVLQAEREMADVEFVDTANGEALVTSPPSLVATLALTGEMDDRLADLGFTGDGFIPDADVGAMYDLVDELLGDQLTQMLSPDRTTMLMTVQTSAGGENVRALVDDLDEAVQPVRDEAEGVTAVSEEALSLETLDALTASQAQKIGFTIVTAAALLIGYYWIARRQPVLGFITLVPTLLALPIVLGAMWLLGLGFNALTATIAAISIGFGVDYGIHLSNRFAEERERTDDAAAAVHETIQHTGAALVASAVTTAGGFAVLTFSGIEPIRQFGIITAVTVLAAVTTTLFAETSALVLWDRLRRKTG